VFAFWQTKTRNRVRIVAKPLVIDALMTLEFGIGPFFSPYLDA